MGFFLSFLNKIIKRNQQRMSFIAVLITSVFCSFIFVYFITYAVTTISTSINTGGTLTVSGASNLNGALWASSTLQSTGAARFYSTARIDGVTILNGVSYTWPSSDGSASQYLQTNGAGALSWAAVSSGASSDWLKQTNYGTLNLTASTTIPYWAKDAIYASSTLTVQGLTTLANASTTQLTNSGLSWFDNLATFTAASTTGSLTIGNAQADILTINAGIIEYISNSTSTTAQNINAWSLATSTTAMPIFTIDGANGRVGIKTARPNAPLHLIGKDSDGATLIIEDNNTPGIDFYDDTTYEGYIESNGGELYIKSVTGTLYLASSAGNYIFIDTAGDVGIGEDTAEAHLEVSADGTTGGPIFYLSSNDDTNGDILTVLESGLFGIGTTTPTTMFQVATSTNNATTTIEIGKVNQNKGSCLKMYNSVGTLTYCKIDGTTFSCSTTNCE